MKLDIISFQDYRDYKLSFPNSGITLLNGRSGSGKTTIIRAIQWCLYGGSASGEKFHVELTYKKIKVIRKSGPKVCEVTKDNTGEIYRGSIAEQIITDYFGSADLFELCCFMKQGTVSCPLLSSVNKDRLLYLSKFAFRDEADPTILLEAISKTLREVRADFETKRVKHRELKKAVSLYISENTISLAAYEDNEEKLKIDLNVANLELEKIGKIKIKQDRQKTIISQVSKQIKELREILEDKEKTLNSLIDGQESIIAITKEKVDLEERLPKCKSELLEIQNKLNIIKISDQFNNLDEIVTSLEKAEIVSVLLSEREYYALETENRQYNENKNECEKLGLSVYSNEALKEKIQFLESLESYQLRKQKYLEWQNTKTTLEEMKTKTTKSAKTEIIALHEMKRSLELLNCPHCQGWLRQGEGGILIAADPAIGPVDKNSIKKQEKLVLTLEEQEKKIQLLESELTKNSSANNLEINETLENYKLGDINIKKHLNALNKIKIVKMPLYTLQQAKLLRSYSSIMKTLEGVNRPIVTYKINDIEKERENLISEEKKIEGRLKALRSSIPKPGLDISGLESIVFNLKEQIQGAEEKLKLEKEKYNYDFNYDDLKNIHNTTISGLKLRINEREIASKILERQEEKELSKSRLSKYRTKMYALANLYENVLQEHHDRLQKVIDDINLCIEDGIDSVIPYPLTLALNLVSPDENEEKRYKKQITYTIIKKGKDKSGKSIENVFSGGEVQRIALLLVIALNNLYKSKLLLLDEIFASLDPDFREDCLVVIKRYLSDRCIIAAEHFAERGDYDHCIDIMQTNAD